jgi:hypothetical protein
MASDVTMGRFIEAASSGHHAAAHDVAMDAIGLHPGSKQYLLDHKLADVAGHLYTHPELVRDQDEGEQLDTVKKLRAKIAGGKDSEEADANEKTDGYLGPRGVRASDRFAALKVQQRENNRRRY